jgi:TM2 domain-containing membrane protein YozV
MRYVLALFLPWLSLLFQGKIGAGILCLILQITIIGWLPATIWAITSLNRMYADRRTNSIITAMRTQKDDSQFDIERFRSR